jgi:serine/threonine protein kinase
MLEVCSALIYMTQKGYVHRDIAARNVLLNSERMAKVSDFGLCRQVDKDGLCVEKDGKFPIKHMPLESIKYGQFSEKSELWSYGILIWEMMSGGQSPFKDIQFDEFIDYLDSGGVPEFSKETPQALIDIFIEQCFQKEPESRGTFVELEVKLNQFYSIVCSFQ